MVCAGRSRPGPQARLVLIHIWWYLTLVLGIFATAVIVGAQTGLWNEMDSYSFGIEWEIRDLEPIENLSVAVTDKEGMEYPIENLKGKGDLSFEFSEGMGKLAIPLYFALFSALGIGLWGIFQLKSLPHARCPRLPWDRLCTHR